MMTDIAQSDRVAAFTFACQGETLLGMVHQADSDSGLLILVGGPQYRIGAHRQYLHLARAAANAGFPTMRFDYRGVGDSSGTYPGFEAVGPDLAAALDAFQAQAPHLRRIFVFGVCEGASAILLHLAGEPRIAGAVLANPWVRTDGGNARALIKHYYWQRLTDPTFWRKLRGGGLDILGSLKSLLGVVKTARKTAPAASFPDRMRDGLARFARPVLLLQSGNDLTAREFDDHAARDAGWAAALTGGRVTRVDLPGVDHTFSSAAWRDQVAEHVIVWMRRQTG